jgi:hypothetical protein
MQSKKNKTAVKGFINDLTPNENNLITDNKEGDYERHNRISALAYQKAENRGFAGSDADALKDWLEAETEINGSASNLS